MFQLGKGRIELKRKATILHPGLPAKGIKLFLCTSTNQKAQTGRVAELCLFKILFMRTATGLELQLFP